MDDPRLKYHDLGFLQVTEPPTNEELKDYYERTYYQTEQASYRKQYSDEEIKYRRLKIAQKAAIVNRLRLSRPPGTMLDVGCGEGFAMAWFREQGWTVQGIDYSSAGLKTFHPDLLPNTQIGDIFALLDEQSALETRYDLIWLSNVLEHVIDPVGLLTSLRRLLASGGVAVVTVPNDGNHYQEDLLKNGDIPHRFWIALPDHLAYFTYESLKRVAQATGYSCEEIIGDFPIDFLLLHEGSNYVRDRTKGPAAHQARLRMELLLGRRDHEQVNRYYAAMAEVGLGRDLTAFMVPK